MGARITTLFIFIDLPTLKTYGDSLASVSLIQSHKLDAVMAMPAALQIASRGAVPTSGSSPSSWLAKLASIGGLACLAREDQTFLSGGAQAIAFGLAVEPGSNSSWPTP
jgi:hypothetical protein